MSSEAERIPGILKALQDQLASSLESNRIIFPHPVAKGDSCEYDWLQTLQLHLPHRYELSSGFVIDSRGSVSDQIDLIVYDRQYTPLLFNRSGQRWIPAESVYAVFEIKQNLNKARIEYAGKKAASVRNLERTNARIPHAGGIYEPRELSPILAGILTHHSDWTPQFGYSLTDAVQGLAPSERIDLGCCVRDGGFEVNYAADGRTEINQVDSSAALLFFFFNLLSRLQALGTAPAIDYSQYMKSLKG